MGFLIQPENTQPEFKDTGPLNLQDRGLFDTADVMKGVMHCTPLILPQPWVLAAFRAR